MFFNTRAHCHRNGVKSKVNYPRWTDYGKKKKIRIKPESQKINEKTVDFFRVV